VKNHVFSQKIFGSVTVLRRPARRYSFAPPFTNYVATLPDGQELLFTDRFTSKKWNRVRERVKMPKLKFHDLRKTFASLLAQRGVSTAVTQRLLEHSTPQLTNEVYTNVDPVLRRAVDRLPVREWL